MDQFKNIITSNRQNFTPADSIEQIRNYALVQDARWRSRNLRNLKVNWFIAALITSYPIYYIFKVFFQVDQGLNDGCWTNIHSDHKWAVYFNKVGKSYRMTYRPEIVLRDQSVQLYDIEKQNIELEKKGEKNTISSPVVLWH